MGNTVSQLEYHIAQLDTIIKRLEAIVAQQAQENKRLKQQLKELKQENERLRRLELDTMFDWVDYLARKQDPTFHPFMNRATTPDSTPARNLTQRTVSISDVRPQ